MTNPTQLNFPELLLLNDYNGDFNAYFQVVYEAFQDDFIKKPPVYNGIRVSAQAHPEVDGLHKTFYHITHEGDVENERIPDIRRMERIKFPKYIIKKCPHDKLLVWKNNRGKDTRVLIYNDSEGYLTVLTERKNYYLFWTAYLIDRTHQRSKLLREYETYKKAETAQ